MHRIILKFLIVYTVFKSTVFGCNVICDCNGLTVVCSNKNLSTVPSGIPKTTKFWYLSSNQITTIEENDFQGFTVLSIMEVNYNQITRLTANVFRELTALSFLILEHNQISVLDATAFQGLTALQFLWMGSNYLTVLDGQTFEGLTSLSHLKLDNNPLTCSNCRMKGFRDFLRNHPHLGNQPTKCDDILIINHNFTDCTDSKSTTNSPSVLLLVVSLYLSLSSLIVFNFPVSKRGKLSSGMPLSHKTDQ